MPYKNPERQKKFMREYRRKQRSRVNDEKKCSTRRFQLNSARSVRRMLAEEANSLFNADLDPVIRSRCLARLCDVILRAVELERGAELEQKLATIEEKLEQMP